jgi:hypothetical protein
MRGYPRRSIVEPLQSSLEQQAHAARALRLELIATGWRGSRKLAQCCKGDRGLGRADLRVLALDRGE